MVEEDCWGFGWALGFLAGFSEGLTDFLDFLVFADGFFEDFTCFLASSKSYSSSEEESGMN